MFMFSVVFTFIVRGLWEFEEDASVSAVDLRPFAIGVDRGARLADFAFARVVGCWGR